MACCCGAGAGAGAGDGGGHRGRLAALLAPLPPPPRPTQPAVPAATSAPQRWRAVLPPAQVAVHQQRVPAGVWAAQQQHRRGQEGVRRLPLPAGLPGALQGRRHPRQAPLRRHIQIHRVCQGQPRAGWGGRLALACGCLPACTLCIQRACARTQRCQPGAAGGQQATHRVPLHSLPRLAVQ